jgi:hypothetical protein
VTHVFLPLGRFGRAARERVRHARVERRAVRRVQRLRDQALEFGFEGNDFEFLHRPVDLLHDRRGDVDADATRQLHRVAHGR